jgi:SAM-dependent methyltransferase
MSDRLGGNVSTWSGTTAAAALNRDLVTWYFDLLGPAQLVLDLGCGKGDIGRLRPPDVRCVVGVDRSELVLRFAVHHESVCVWDGESNTLPFRDEVFNAIVAKDILEHLPRPWTIVREMHRVLRSGGRVIVSVPRAKAKAVWDDYTHVRGFTGRALKALLEDHGFEATRLLRMGAVPMAGRLKLVRVLPKLLIVPPMSWLFWSNHMLIASKR